MSINSEITAVNNQIQKINDKIDQLEKERSNYVNSLGGWKTALETRQATLEQYQGDRQNCEVDFGKSFKNNVKYGATREPRYTACKNKTNGWVSSAKLSRDEAQGKVWHYEGLIKDRDTQIATEEANKKPYEQQLIVLKGKQEAENKERDTLAQQGISTAKLLKTAELEGAARMKESEAIASVTVKTGEALIDEKEEAERIKNQKAKVWLYVGIAVAVVMILAMVLILKKKLGKKSKGGKK